MLNVSHFKSADVASYLFVQGIFLNKMVAKCDKNKMFVPDLRLTSAID